MNSKHPEEKLILILQLICFIMSFLIGVTFNSFHESVAEKLLKMNVAFFIAGCILLALKLARDGSDIVAAGFTLLAIGWGAFFAALDFSSEKVGGHIFSSAFYFILPSTILMSLYKPFPWWIKVLLLLCNFPFFMILRAVSNSEPLSENKWITPGFALLHITSVVIGTFFLIKYFRSKRMRG